jgi:two-component system sensor histidine kinase RcsD
VVAFDLPINDLIPPDMPLDSFRLEPDPRKIATTPDKEAPTASISFNGSKIEIASAQHHRYAPGVAGAVWHAAAGSLQNILLPLLLNIGLLALALFGYTTFRHQPGRRATAPGPLRRQQRTARAARH